MSQRWPPPPLNQFLFKFYHCLNLACRPFAMQSNRGTSTSSPCLSVSNRPPQTTKNSSRLSGILRRPSTKQAVKSCSLPLPTTEAMRGEPFPQTAATSFAYMPRTGKARTAGSALTLKTTTTISRPWASRCPSPMPAVFPKPSQGRLMPRQLLRRWRPTCCTLQSL